MKKKKTINIFLLILFIVALTFFILNRIISKNNNFIETKFPDNAKILAVNSTDDKAPEIKNNGKWINTDKEITLEGLKGKVVLIEFWTFGCYNCRNTLPYLKQWYEKYKSDQFEMIGIHCPEFDSERNFDNVRKNVEELGIKYPILTDNEFSIWDRYNVHACQRYF